MSNWYFEYKVSKNVISRDVISGGQGLPVTIEKRDFDRFFSSLGYYLVTTNTASSHFKFENRNTHRTVTCVKSTDDPYYFISVLTEMLSQLRQIDKEEGSDHFIRTREFLKMNDRERKKFLRQKKMESQTEVAPQTVQVERKPKDISWKNKSWYADWIKSQEGNISNTAIETEEIK
jgi:hypothetical protein